MSFSNKILLWYAQNKRDLPWRATSAPYNIWLSEIILQQTKVAQGTPYYLKFITEFPTVFDLAAASEAEVLKLWQGLGYYSRARNLHSSAKMVVKEYNGIFPNSFKGLLALKGVGDYTASAIASICFDLPEPVVDGNVYRVLARYFGVDDPINSSSGIKYFKELARKVMSADYIKDYNQGLMEFGALQCVPKKPDCTICPLQDSCVALAENKITILPVKINKTKVRKRYFNYIIPIHRNSQGKINTLLQQRLGKGIWQGLWEFPLLETEELVGVEEVVGGLPELLNLKKEFNLHNFSDKVVVHKLSHQHLYTKFWILDIEESLENAISVTQLEKFPVPVLIADFIKTFKI